MSPLDWGVVAAGIAAIAWVNWYFFLAERGSAVAAAPTGQAPTGVTASAVPVPEDVARRADR